MTSLGRKLCWTEYRGAWLHTLVSEKCEEDERRNGEEKERSLERKGERRERMEVTLDLLFWLNKEFAEKKISEKTLTEKHTII